MASKKEPCPEGYRRNRNGRCVPKRSGEVGLATSMFGIIGAFIGGNKQKEKDKERRRQMLAGIHTGDALLDTGTIIIDSVIIHDITNSTADDGDDSTVYAILQEGGILKVNYCPNENLPDILIF